MSGLITNHPVLLAFGFVLAVIGYVLPSYLAYRRRVPDLLYLVTFNLCWGWTGLGWAGALAVALMQPVSPADKLAHA